jgi:hypothetical protein
MTGVLVGIYGRNNAGETASHVTHFKTAPSLVMGQFGCYP